MRVALVEEHGLAAACGELEMHAKGALLVGVWREVPEEVQAAFADRGYFRQLRKIGQRWSVGLVKLPSVMRMHPGGRTQKLRPGTHEIHGGARACECAAGDHGEADAGLPGSRHHTLTIAVEAVVREIEPDVRQHEIHAGQAARNASVTGSRAARNAGNSPPTSPMPSAHLSPFQSSSGETLNWNITWLKLEPRVAAV